MKKNKLIINNISAEELITKFGSPLYVYQKDIIEEKYRSLTENINLPNVKFFYACKANSNPKILKILLNLGSGIETVSIGEVKLALKAGFKRDQIIFTSSNMTLNEIKFVIKNHIFINVDSLHQLEAIGKLVPNSEISIRVNQGIGAGHHVHVITGGSESKFGIYFTQLDDAKKIAKKYGLKIVGLQQHIGSNILDEKIFIKAMKALLKTATDFSDLKYLDFGGGFGVPYRPDEPQLDLEKLGGEISILLNNFFEKYGRDLKIRFEPGRFLVAESGILLATVVDIKETPTTKFIGIDSGFNHLVRPAMYDSYHEIINASRIKGIKETVSIAGNICESGDVFARKWQITKPKIGDILAILNAGAYGYSMSSNYNSRLKPAEVLVSGDKARLIRKPI